MHKEKNPHTKSSLNQRDSFSSNYAFILSCVGSAVGMGNIWLFPYRVGQFGGAAFLIPYLFFILLLGVTGVVGEMSFGRAMKTGPVGAFKKAFERRGWHFGEWVGMIPVIGALGIAVGYSVVVGWILRFTVSSFAGMVTSPSVDSVASFHALSGSFGSVGWHFGALLLTFAVMLFGITSGIERLNKYLMPAFFGFFLFLAVRVFFLEGANIGYAYLFKPRWESLLDIKTWIYALGQAFFSLSLAGSGTIVYGSYLDNKEDVVRSAKYVVFFDTVAALLAALVIVPSVFAFNLDLQAGPGLMFLTMPEVFKQLSAGRLFASIFFLAVLFASLTSLVNLFEAPIETLQDSFSLSRGKAVGIIAILGATIGLFIERGDILSLWMDIVSIYLIPLGALLAAFVFFWVCGDSFVQKNVQLGREKELGAWFTPLSKYLFCGLTLVVYLLGIFYGGIG